MPGRRLLIGSEGTFESGNECVHALNRPNAGQFCDSDSKKCYASERLPLCDGTRALVVVLGRRLAARDRHSREVFSTWAVADKLPGSVAGVAMSQAKLAFKA